MRWRSSAARVPGGRGRCRPRGRGRGQTGRACRGGEEGDKRPVRLRRLGAIRRALRYAERLNAAIPSVSSASRPLSWGPADACVDPDPTSDPAEHRRLDGTQHPGGVRSRPRRSLRSAIPRPRRGRESPYSNEIGCDVALAQHVECFADGEVTTPDGQDPDARTGAFDDRFGRVSGRGRVLLRKSVNNLLVFLGDLGVSAALVCPDPRAK